MHNIAFIANHDITFLYHEIASNLSKIGVKIYWISPSPKLYGWLLKHYDSQHILCINFKDHGHEALADFNINELVYGDRVLSFEKQKGIRYLSSIQKPIADFLTKNDIKFIFGEKTWAHEELIYRITTFFKEWGCKFLSPHTIRIPTGKFAFFEDPEMKLIYKYENSSDVTIRPIEIESPDYLKKNDFLLKKKNSLPGLILRFWRLVTFQNYDKGNPCRPKLIHTIVSRIEIIANRIYYYNLPRKKFEDIDKPYLFLTLHYQPEASVDVMGRYYEDQKRNIKNIWRKLPKNWLLVIKEHSNAVGCRGKSFFKELLELPGVILVDEKESSIRYLETAEAVISITGTIGLEALLKKRIALLFGNPHFSGYGTCYPIRLQDLKESYTMIDLITRKTEKKQKSIDDFELMISKYSFKGIISSPSFNSNCMTPSNIENISNAFIKILKL